MATPSRSTSPCTAGGPGADPRRRPWHRSPARSTTRPPAAALKGATVAIQDGGACGPGKCDTGTDNNGQFRFRLHRGPADHPGHDPDRRPQDRLRHRHHARSDAGAGQSVTVTSSSSRRRRQLLGHGRTRCPPSTTWRPHRSELRRPLRRRRATTPRPAATAAPAPSPGSSWSSPACWSCSASACSSSCSSTARRGEDDDDGGGGIAARSAGYGRPARPVRRRCRRHHGGSPRRHAPTGMAMPGCGRDADRDPPPAAARGRVPGPVRRAPLGQPAQLPAARIRVPRQWVRERRSGQQQPGGYSPAQPPGYDPGTQVYGAPAAAARLRRRAGWVPAAGRVRRAGRLRVRPAAGRVRRRGPPQAHRPPGYAAAAPVRRGDPALGRRRPPR